jgi:transposase-like protein
MSKSEADDDQFACPVCWQPLQLPGPNPRWTPGRKAAVVQAVKEELLTAEEACQRYDLTMDELAGWTNALERGGVGALRVTRLQESRRNPRKRIKPKRARNDRTEP